MNKASIITVLFIGLVFGSLMLLMPDRPTMSAIAMSERAKMLKLAVPDVQKQYQSIMLEVDDRYVTIRAYCYRGTLIFTNITGEPFGASSGACAWKSH